MNPAAAQRVRGRAARIALRPNVPHWAYSGRMDDTRMSDAAEEFARQVMSRAGRQAARARWGTTRIDHLVAELRDRVDDLGPDQIANLKDLVTAASGTTERGETHE